MKKIAINGFGRIGRVLFRILVASKQYKVVAINDVANPRILSHLLKYDSVHGVFPYSIDYTDNSIICNGEITHVSNCNDINMIDWKKHDVDVVFECTGLFKSRLDNLTHISSGAKKVILSSAPSDHDIQMVVLGVNESQIDFSDQIISNASCTTNCAAPMIKLINDFIGIKSAYVTTIHSYTADQNLHDSIHSDLRRARSAPNSIIPTTTGAAKALSYIFPDLEIGGCGIRVPVPNGSLIDITCVVDSHVSADTINDIFKKESQSNLKGIMSYNIDPIVSVDVISNPYSCIFDSQLTYTMSNMIKVVGWYDNEYGYSSRLVDLLSKVH